MLHLIIEVFCYFLPVYILNVLVYLVWLRLGLGVPLDLGYYDEKRIIGNSRGLSGFVFHLFALFFICNILGRDDYYLLSMGFFLGTTLSSIIKRYVGINRGDFSYLDQNDYVLGILFLSYLYEPISGSFIIVSLVLGFILHILINLGRPICKKIIKRIELN